MKLARIMRRLATAALALTAAAFVVAYVRSSNDCETRLAAAPRDPMRAVLACDYGTPDVIRVARVEKPVPGDGELLVRVRAASVNPLDWHSVRGTPMVMRLSSGLRKPHDPRVGVDFAGVVDAVGPGVTGYRPGDEVFGARTGAFADYILATPARIARKPAAVTFEQAAAVPVAAITALQGLRDKGGLKQGEKVLINGASGGVGTYAVQIARHLGAEVTGVCSTRNVELVRSLGAHHVIDYTREDFTTGSARYDVLLDNVGNRSLSESRRVLTEQGRYVLVGAGGPNDHRWLGPLGRIAVMWVSAPLVSQTMAMFIARLSPDDLALLAGLMEAGAVTSVIDRRFPLEQAADAVRYVESGRARGKVIVTVD